MPKKRVLRNKKISIVIPVYNEEEVINELAKRLQAFIKDKKNYRFEVIFVENGSTDNSFSLLKKYSTKNPHFKVIALSKNIGPDGAITAGMRYVRGDACVIMMADLQEPIELIGKFIEKWAQGYDIVYGVVKKRTAGALRNLNARLFYKVMNFFTHGSFPQNASDFRLIDKKVYEAINTMNEHNKYLRGLIMWTGFKHIGVPFDRKRRFAGESKADIRTVIAIALNGIFSFSYLPLRIVSVFGLCITIASFGLIIFYMILFFTHGREAPGVITIILLILFLFGILFFVLGVISEYLARIYDEVKGRPHFIVKDTVNIS